MPDTKFIQLQVNNKEVEITPEEMQNIAINYTLEQPGNFGEVHGNSVWNVTVPATPANDAVFNTFHNAAVEDMTPGQECRNYMQARLSANGTVTLLNGQAVLTEATFTDKPETYTIDLQGGNADWIINGQNMTLWDCLSQTPHVFNTDTIENSWKDAIAGGFDSDEAHDFVYAPVRYRQPFTWFDATGMQHGNDDEVTAHMLRPSISAYWLLVRGFRQLGYTIKSQFLETPNYFRRMVLPWTWGDFFDINSKLTDGVAFKAAGKTWTGTSSGYVGWGVDQPIYFGGAVGVDPSRFPDNTGWLPWGPYSTSYGPLAPGRSGYIQSMSFDVFGTMVYHNFRIDNVNPPAGYDNFGLYSFDESRGEMKWTYNPPPELMDFIGDNITATFTLSLLCKTTVNDRGNHTRIVVEKSINGSWVEDEPIMDLWAVLGHDKGSLLYPTNFTFNVSNINRRDTVSIRLKYEIDPGDYPIAQGAIILFSSYLENTNPNVTGANNWQHDSATGEWYYANPSSTPQWQNMYSTLTMTRLTVQLGGNVNFQFYDAFRNYKFFDFLSGLCDMFNLEIETDQENKCVVIEPMFGTTLPDGTVIDGYFNENRVMDWTDKQDLNKVNTHKLFTEFERQVDFTFKTDGADGGQNIWAARYKGIYLNKVKTTYVKRFVDNNGIVDEGLYAAVPGAARYVLPDRFPQGSRRLANRFFSAVMHYKHELWKGISWDYPDTPAPQLVTIFPENVNDSSSGAITQAFEPKLCFYKGQMNPATDGAWRWIGDPSRPYVDPIALHFQLPKMFAVNYHGADCSSDPILNYNNEYVDGAIVPGLLQRYFLKRMAIIRNGLLAKYQVRLNLKDICNNTHRETVYIKKTLFALIGIDNYKPLTDDSCECTLWKIVPPGHMDMASCYPSDASIINNAPTRDPFDIKYATTLLFITDIPVL